MLKYQDPKNPRVRVALVPYASGVNAGDLAERRLCRAVGQVEPSAGGERSRHRRQEGDDRTAGFRHICLQGRLGLPARRQLRDRAQGQGRQARFHRRRPGHGAPQQEWQEILRARELATINLSGGDERMSGSEDHPADGRSGRRCWIRSTTSRRTALRPARSPSSGPTTCCRRNGGMRSRPQSLGDGPADHDERKISKVAILMTDGQFNTAFAGVSSNFNGQGS